jgi:hypothetical protein
MDPSMGTRDHVSNIISVYVITCEYIKKPQIGCVHYTLFLD